MTDVLKPEVKADIRKLWNAFWSGGIANPLTAIEQISYLIFLKRLNDIRPELFANHPTLQWRSLMLEGDAETVYRRVRDEAFPFLQGLAAQGEPFAVAMKDAVFMLPKPSLLQQAMGIIDKLQITDQDFDTQGDIYEELLSELNLAGKNGQFRTPRHIIRTMVALADPDAGQRVCDPAAGTGGFLVTAYQWLLKRYTPDDPAYPTTDPATGEWQHLTGELLDRAVLAGPAMDGSRFVGYDFDTTMVRVGVMNMMLHGISRPQLTYGDTLGKRFSLEHGSDLGSYDVVLANPPFTGNLELEDVDSSLGFKTGKTELLFLKRCFDLLDNGGRCAIIVPEGVLFGSSKVHQDLRKLLLTEAELNAVISLPGGVFRPYTGVKTSILFFTKGGTTKDKSVWFYTVTGDGRTLDDKRGPDPSKDDLRFVAQAYHALHNQTDAQRWRWTFSEAEQEQAQQRVQLVSFDEIVAKGYNLAAASYRADSSEAEPLDPPAVILARVRELQAQVDGKLERIATLLAEVGQ